VTNDAQCEKNNVKVGFSSQRLGTTFTHRVERGVDQADINTLEIRFTESRSAEVAREELYEPEVWCNVIVDLLLMLG
jgi:hypothetical protein